MTAKRGQYKAGTKGAWLFRYAERCPKWEERRDALLKNLAQSTHGWRWNGRRRAKRSQHNRDILRAISEGLMRVTERQCRTVKMLVLTDAGRALIAVPAVVAPDPWAKRRKGIAEFKVANR
jgi:hypothetical protein